MEVTPRTRGPKGNYGRSCSFRVFEPSKAERQTAFFPNPVLLVLRGLGAVASKDFLRIRTNIFRHNMWYVCPKPRIIYSMSQNAHHGCTKITRNDLGARCPLYEISSLPHCWPPLPLTTTTRRYSNVPLSTASGSSTNILLKMALMFLTSPERLQISSQAMSRPRSSWRTVLISPTNR